MFRRLFVCTLPKFIAAAVVIFAMGALSKHFWSLLPAEVSGAHIAAPTKTPPEIDFPCTYCTEPSDENCKICIRDNHRMEVGPDGLASSVFQICNGSDQAVKLALAVSDFSSLGVGGKPFQLNTTRKVTGEAAADKPIVEQGKALEANSCVRARLEVDKLWQAGPMTATLFSGKTEIVKLVALRLQVPFGLKIKGANPQAVELSLVRGEPATIQVQNHDMITYRFKWHLRLGEVALDGSQIVGPMSEARLPITLNEESVNWLESGFLRTARLHGQLVLKHEPDDSFRDLPMASHTFPVTANLSYYGSDAQGFSNVAWTLGILLLGILGSLLINYALPMQRQRVALKQRTADEERRLDGCGEAVGPYTLTVLRVERRRLRAAVNDLSSFFPETEIALPLLKSQIDTFSKRVDLAIGVSTHLTALKGIRSLALHEIEQVVDNCSIALKVVAQASPTDSEVQKSKAALDLAAAQLAAGDQIPLPAAIDSLRQLVPTIASTIGNAPDLTVPSNSGKPSDSEFWDNLEKLRTALNSESSILGTAPAIPTRHEYIRASLAIWKAEKIINFTRLVRNAESSTVARQRMDRAGELISALAPGADCSTYAARSLIQQIEQNVSEADLIAALEPGAGVKVWIDANPSTTAEFQIVSLRLRLSKVGLDESAARQKIKCRWKVNDKLIEGDGWTAFTYFELPGTLKSRRAPVPFQVSVEVVSGTKLIKPEPLTITLLPKIFFRSSTALSLGSLMITVVIVTIGLLTAAQEKLQSLGWASGVVALLLLGFGADVIKRALSKP